jgi:hypothetical protein
VKTQVNEKSKGFFKNNFSQLCFIEASAFWCNNYFFSVYALSKAKAKVKFLQEQPFFKKIHPILKNISLFTKHFMGILLKLPSKLYKKLVKKIIKKL